MRFILSHADLDHYNCLPELLPRIDVRRVLTGPGTWQDAAPPLAALDRLISSHGVVQENIAAGATVSLDNAVTIRVLAPRLEPDLLGGTGALPKLQPASDTAEKGAASIAGECRESDNSLSIVLLVEFADHRILLPGDLEGPGLERLMEFPPVDCTAILAPHHGSPHSQPDRFVAWSTPEFIFISGDESKVDSSAYDSLAVGGAQQPQVFRTSAVGAIFFEIQSTGSALPGRLSCSSWLTPDSQSQIGRR